MRKGSLIQHLINAAIFIVLEVAALNMLKNNGPLQGVWISRGVHAVMGTVWGGTQSLKQYFSLRKTNDALAQENFELRKKVAELEALTGETHGGGIGQPAEGYRYTPATIVKISNNTGHNYMIIGKGSEDGITEGSGIITGRGAIGVIDAVGSHHSYARSFKNHEMSISARLGREGTVGPLSWDGLSSSGAILKEIPLHMEFQPGDTVYTSGFSSIFPPDIPLGITGESKVVNGATYEIKIDLFEDFGALRYVTVVENLGKEEIKSLEEEQ